MSKQKKKKRKLLPIAIIAVVLLLIIAVVGKQMGFIGQKDNLKVSVEETDKRTIVETVLANGKILPEIEVKISPEISGEIIALAIAEGDSVKKGQLLVRINPEILQAGMDRGLAAVNNSKANLNNSKARLAQVQANFDNTQITYKRNKKLFEDKVISEAEFLGSKAAYEAAKQEIEAAKQTVKAAEYTVKSSQASLKEVNENLTRTTIYSPIDGVVTALNVELGERVVGTAQMAGTELMRIADLNIMQANVEVSETDIVNVSIGDTAVVEVDAYPDKKFKGVVKEIANSANSSMQNLSDQVTNFEVKINLIQDSYKELSAKKAIPFRPGLSTSVEIQTERAADILTVPIQSVTVRVLNEDGKVKSKRRSRRGKSSSDSDKEDSKKSDEEEELTEIVFVVENGKAKSVKVETGIQDDQFIEIKSGLKSGAKVISGPFNAISKKLEDDLEIDVTDKDKLFSDKK